MSEQERLEKAQALIQLMVRETGVTVVSTMITAYGQAPEPGQAQLMTIPGWQPPKEEADEQKEETDGEEDDR